MTVFPPPMGAFPPNTRYDNQKSYGDLANLGNLPDFRQYRHEIFTTDFRGFRNLPQFESNSRPEILLLGDSFGAGAGVTDMDSPGVQLSAALHRNVYNAAGRPNDLDLVLNLIHNLDFRGGMILWQLSERFDLPEGDLGLDAAPGHLAFLPAQARQQFRRLRSVVEQPRRYSPYRILLTRLYRYLQNDRILPNRQASSVFIAELRDGERMLILRDEIQNARKQRPVSVRGVSRIVEEIRKTGNDIVFILVPDKYTIYLPLIANMSAELGEGEYMDRVAAKMQQAGVPVLNLLPILRQEAERRLDRRETIYWKDDTHWNPEGIRFAVQVISAHLPLRLPGAASFVTAQPPH